MPTPNIDRLANEGMTFFSFYAQPSCTPGRAAMQTGRIPNRSGMTTVAFQGQGGGLPAAEWTLASVLKTGGLPDLLHRQVASGRGRLRAAQRPGLRRDEVCGLYHLNAYTYADPTWFPDMDPELRAMFAKVTKGSLSGKAGEPANEDFKINGQYVDTPEQGRRRHSLLRRLRREGGARVSRQGGQVRQAVLHERQLHEGAPAEHAAPRLHPQVDVQEQVRRLGRRARRPHRPRSWTRSARSVSTRTRWSSTRPTTAPGRTSTPMPATRRSAAPRAPCAKAATACPPSRGCRARSRPARRTTTSSAGWT